MQVLHVSKYYPPTFGGLEKVVYDIVEGLAQRNMRADVLCAAAGGAPSCVDLGSGYTITRKREYAKIAATPIAPSLLSHFSSTCNQYDIIHIHLPNPLANLAVMLGRTRAKVVLHWHSDIIKQKHLLKLYRPMQNWLLRRADSIIVTSPNYLEGSEQLEGFKHKAVVIPIGIDASELTPQPDLVGKIRREYQGRTIVFALGRLTRYKGFEYLIEAARSLQDCVVLLGGKGEEQARLEGLIERYGVRDHVRMLGGIPHTELASYYAAADIFCLPSYTKNEAFGVVQLEAMTFGKPVVSTNIAGSGVPWVNAHEVSGLICPPSSVSALAAAIQRLADDPELRQRLGAQAYQRAHTLFSVNQMVESTHALYTQLLNKS